MKILLACLMCLVLGATECFAISGGPVFPGGTNVVGTYAGVMKTSRFCVVCENDQETQIKCKDLQSYLQEHPGAIPGSCSLQPDCSANSLGVFSVGVPSSGIATGTFVMFSQGRVFTGTIRGTADPGRATLTGVLDATFDFTLTRTFVNPITGEVTTTTTQVTASANGNLRTRISSALRLAGTATLNISQGQVDGANEPVVTCEMTLRVSGFKQSNTAPGSTG
jgi:hypothetical protein